MRIVAIVLLLSLCFIGCAGRNRITPWYPELLILNDTISLLEGRKIVLDPGHGGKFAGAVGSGGLTEKEINLKVALALKKRLELAGAKVFLTRQQDSDFSGTSGTLSEDLAYRSLYSDSIMPDLFISLHHNASNPYGSDSLGDIVKTFYKSSDDGPSLDAASSIHSSFVKYLGFEKNRLLSGNYSVLRKTSSPAVLGEPSYISNPVVEKLLKSESGAETEAEAYYRGVVCYFSKGVPKLDSFKVDSAAFTIAVYYSCKSPLVESATLCYLDGQAIQPVFKAGRFILPAHGFLGNGKHTLAVSLMNINGNFSATTVFSFVVDREAVQLAVFAARDSGRKGELIPVRIIPFDAHGNPVADGTAVYAGDDIGVVRNGFAKMYIPCTSKPLQIRCGEASAQITIPEKQSASQFCQVMFNYDGQMKKAELFCMDTATGRVFCPDENGFAEFPVTVQAVKVCGREVADTVILLVPDSLVRINLSRKYEVHVTAKKIVIDPEFGGAESGYVSPEGVRASDINRKFARILAGLLVSEGFEVKVAREGDEDVSVASRITSAAKFDADYYLVLRSDSTNLSYCTIYPGNPVSEKFAKSLTAEISGGIEIKKETSYLLQQTPCTAAIIKLVSLDNGNKNTDKLVEFAIGVKNTFIKLYQK